MKINENKFTNLKMNFSFRKSLLNQKDSKRISTGERQQIFRINRIKVDLIKLIRQNIILRRSTLETISLALINTFYEKKPAKINSCKPRTMTWPGLRIELVNLFALFCFSSQEVVERGEFSSSLSNLINQTVTLEQMDKMKKDCWEVFWGSTN